MGTGLAFVTLEDQQVANFRKRKPQLLRASNELNALNVLQIKQSKAAFGAWRAIQQPLFS
jgi:hypothetical protein